MKTYILFSILSAFLFAQNPEPKPCNYPAVATDDFGKKFRYGCFCGENYPNIQHPSKKNYRDLNITQKQELIAQYNAIAPYDDNTLFDISILMINGALTAFNKGFQESIDILTKEENLYPPSTVKCNITEK